MDDLGRIGAPARTALKAICDIVRRTKLDHSIQRTMRINAGLFACIFRGYPTTV